ncbi:MAG: Omp28-related outer membrane protein [Bacteroidetes bacterium]|nr:Omp28-related outer membrane protein [Bacteroidota bacterium]
MKRKLLSLLLLLTIGLYFGCRVDNTQKAFDNITVSNQHNSFIFMLADQGNYFSDDAHDTIFNKALSGNMNGVNASRLYGMTLYPDVFFDTTLFTSTAESFLRLFDNNGNKTFSSYPSIFEGMTNHQKTYSTWKHAIDSTQKAPSVCGIGLAKEEFGSSVNIYAKVEFYSSVNAPVFLAVYLVENTVVAPQRVTPSDTSFSYSHHHVLVAAGNGDFGQSISSSPVIGITYKVPIQLTVPGNINKSNLEYLVVIYQSQGDSPIKVLNCSSIK